MGFVDDILADTLPARRSQHERAWPVGRGDVFAWESTWGHDDSRFSPASNEDYLQVNEILTVATARARLMSDLELLFYDRRGKKKKEIEPDEHRAVALYHYVNPHFSQARLARMDELAMCIWGESFWLVGPPTPESPMGEIWWLKPSKMSPIIHPERYVVAWRYETDSGEILTFLREEVVWFRYPNPVDHLAALPPLYAAKLAADTAQAMQKSNRQLFTQGLQIAGLVFPAKPDDVWTQEQVNGMEMFLRRKFTTAEKANRWAVLRQEAKFQQISMTPKDAEFIAGINMTYRQICRVYGMQATLLGDLEQASPGDTRELERIEWARTLGPDARLRSQEIEEQYLPMFARDSGAPRHAAFDFSRVSAIQENEAALWEREAGQVDRGLMSGNEWRRRRGWEDVDWLEYPWMPMNKGMFVPEGEEPKGKLVIPGQDPNMFGGGGGFGGFGGDEGFGGESNSADDGWPAAAQQGGPVRTGSDGVPLEVLPDDERNPLAAQERGWRDFADRWDDPREAPTRLDAHRFLREPEVQEFLSDAVWKLNGHRPKLPALSR